MRDAVDIVLGAINVLDDRIAGAPAIPYTDQVRLERRELVEDMNRLRTQMQLGLGPEPERAEAVSRALDALADLEQVVASAKRIPLTDQIRINKERAYEPLDRLRQALPGAIAEAHAAHDGAAAIVVERIDALDALFEGAGRTTLTRRLEVDAHELRNAAAGVRVAAVQSLREPSAELDAALRELDALIAGAPETGTAVVHPRARFELIDRLRWAAVAAAKLPLRR